jgi:hypothetical protein
MDRLDECRQYIRDLLTEIGSYRGLFDTVRSQLIFDTEGDHYQLMRIGWRDKKRIYGCIIHFDIIDDKIWLQHNSTDIDVAKRLVEMGVLNSDIVLGFQPSYIRKFTEYAVG